MPNIKKVKTQAGISWQVDYYEPGGRRVQKRYPRRALAEAALAKAVAAISEGRYGDLAPLPRITLAELAEDYLRAHKAQRSFHSFKADIIRVIVAAFGDRALHEINYRDLEIWRNERLATPTVRKRARSPARVNREMAVLRHMINKAIEWGLLRASPFKAGRPLTLKEPAGNHRFLTGAEEARLIAECPGHLRPVVELALETGLRAGELFGLRWDHIRHGFAYIPAGMAKSGKGRPVPLSRRAEEILMTLRARYQLTSPYVFGKRINNVRKSFAGALRRAGIEGFRFHDLRHTYASKLVRRGVPLRVVQAILGHADIKMTLRYSHLSPGDLKSAVAVLDTPTPSSKYPADEPGPAKATQAGGE